MPNIPQLAVDVNSPPPLTLDSSAKVVVVMPAYNAGQTLDITYKALPHHEVHSVILVDDGSKDDTVAIASQLPLKLFVHNRNYGYGANQKTCYVEALAAGAEIIVMVHPDYQYDPTLLPELLLPIRNGEVDVMFGSRMKGDSAWRAGMPWWKYIANRFLTIVENFVFGLQLSEYHTGYRAYTRKALEHVNFRANSDSFIFDQEIVAQFVSAGFRIGEIAVPTRYFPAASSASFWASVRYGLGILWLTLRYLFHVTQLKKQRQFYSLKARYVEVS